MTRVTITLDGRSHTVDQRGTDTILETARWAGLRVKTSCEAGYCATCMALVTSGRAEMRLNDALDDDDIAEGWVLTCQAVPVTDEVTVVFDP